MALALYSFFIILTLFSSLHVNARETQFFSKVTRVPENDTSVKETDLSNREEPLRTQKNLPANDVPWYKQEEEPNFIPQNTQDGYGLYGHEAGLLPPATDITFASEDSDNYGSAAKYNSQQQKYYSYDDRYITKQQQPYYKKNMYNTEQSQYYVVAKQYEQLHPHNVVSQYKARQEQYTHDGNSYNNFFEKEYYINGDSYNKEDQGTKGITVSENEKYDHNFNSKKNYRNEYGNYYGNYKNKEKYDFNPMEEYEKSQNLYNP